MIIVDNLLSETELNDLRKAIDHEVNTYGRRFEECDFREETDHLGTENSNLYYLKNEARQLFLECLVKNNYLHDFCLEGMDLTLRYHILTSPYISVWHKDRLADWDGDNIDYIGISYFMNERWTIEDGGLYIYKESKDSTTGQYVEPLNNRLIINDKDLYHGVTRITNPEVNRYSLQMFINKEYVK